MLIRIFNQGGSALVEAPDDAIVHHCDTPGLPDMLELPGNHSQEGVLLSESVVISAARQQLYGLRLLSSEPTVVNR